MFEKAKEIFNGWRNDLMPPKHLKKLIKDVSDERMKICTECPKNSVKAKEDGYTSIRTDFHCTVCSCPLQKKTKSLHSSCPIGKWEALLTKEELEKLENEKPNKEGDS